MVCACRQRHVDRRHLDTQPSNTYTWLCLLFARTHTHTCRWYHGNISRREAKIILQDFRGGNGSFLVRSSESYAGKFAISFVWVYSQKFACWSTCDVCVELVLLIANILCINTSAHFSIWQSFLEHTEGSLYFGIIHSHYIIQHPMKVHTMYIPLPQDGHTYTPTCIDRPHVYITQVPCVYFDFLQEDWL